MKLWAIGGTATLPNGATTVFAWSTVAENQNEAEIQGMTWWKRNNPGSQNLVCTALAIPDDILKAHILAVERLNGLVAVMKEEQKK